MKELITLTVQRIIITLAAHILFIIDGVPLFLSFLGWPEIFGLKSLCLVNIGRSVSSTYQAADFTIKAFDILPHLISQPVLSIACTRTLPKPSQTFCCNIVFFRIETEKLNLGSFVLQSQITITNECIRHLPTTSILYMWAGICISEVCFFITHRFYLVCWIGVHILDDNDSGMETWKLVCTFENHRITDQSSVSCGNRRLTYNMGVNQRLESMALDLMTNN